jgi:hypothetical protein
MRLIAGAAALLVGATARNVRANSSAHLVYSRTTDAAECPDEETLRKAVASRFGYDPFFAWAKKTLVVWVTRDHGSYVGRLQIVDDAGLARGTREIRSNDESCSELFDALALAISIALDASAQLLPKPSAVQPPPPSAPEPPPAPALPTITRVEPPTPPRPVPIDNATPWAVGGDLAASAGLGPSPGPRAAAFARWWSRRNLPLSLGAELSVDWSLPLSVVPDGTVSSTFVAGTLVPCIHHGAAVICLLGELGWLHAAASEVVHPNSDGMLFAALGGRVGVEWPFTDRLFMRFHGDALVDVTRPDFQIGNYAVWNAAEKRKPVIGSMGLGIGYRLP